MQTMRLKHDDEREPRLSRDPRASAPSDSDASGGTGDGQPQPSRRGAERALGEDHLPRSARGGIEAVLAQDRIPASARRSDAALSAPRLSRPESPSPASIVTSQDPRLPELETLFTSADWEGVVRKLGPPDQAGRLPPNLGLLYALASKELTPPDDKAPSKDSAQRDATANQIAIRCAAGLLGVAPDSPLALLLAKRLLRRNPVAWQKRPAPSALVSVLIVGFGLFIGAGIGWLVSFGYVTVRLPAAPFLP
jgi:hypothetical protein